MWALGQHLQPSHPIQPEPFDGRAVGHLTSLCALEKFPLQNLSALSSQVALQLRMFSQTAHSLQKLWQLNLATFHISHAKKTC